MQLGSLGLRRPSHPIQMETYGSPRLRAEPVKPKNVAALLATEANTGPPIVIHQSEEESIPIVNREPDPFWVHSRKERDAQIDRGIAGNKGS